MAPEIRLALEALAAIGQLLLYVAEPPDTQREHNAKADAVAAMHAHIDAIRLTLTKTTLPPLPHE